MIIVEERTSRSRYIGSKARIAAEILDHIGYPSGDSGAFLDVFSGTGVISREVASRGWTVSANDHLISSALMTTANLLSDQDICYAALGGYSSAIEKLNAAPPREGFIYREYTPSGLSRSGHKRQYFTTENGQRIDGMRAEIEAWADVGYLSNYERALLIADLISAVNSVANIAGTYGCFLRHWDVSALHPIEVTPRMLLSEQCRFVVQNEDVFSVPSKEADVAYLDPPYTKRHYAAYYHILETIAAGDSPLVGGVTGLRPWREKASPFCYKTKALRALDRLLSHLRARRILLSYSSEGHVPITDLEETLSHHGDLEVHVISGIGRYRPNQGASAAGALVTEYLIEVNRALSRVEVRL